MTQVLESTLLKRLQNAARRRKQAEETAAKFRTLIDGLVLEGHAAEIPKTQLAEAAGLTRQTIYTIILKGGQS